MAILTSLALGTAIAGAAGSGASSIIGASKARKERRRQKEAILQRQQLNQLMYDKEYNEAATERADAVKAMTAAKSALLSASRKSNAAAATGVSQEAAARDREMATQALADVASNIVVSNDARKRDVQRAYLKNTMQNMDDYSSIGSGAADGWAAASDVLSGLSSVGMAAAGALDGKGTADTSTDVPKTKGGSASTKSEIFGVVPDTKMDSYA